MPLACACSASRSSVPSTAAHKLKSTVSKSSLPASILEKSRMSLMIASKASALLRMVSANSRCSVFNGVSSSSPLMPMMPFIGVRISWLMLAKNSDFTRTDSSAASRASASSASISLRSVMSRMTQMNPPPSIFASETSCG